MSIKLFIEVLADKQETFIDPVVSIFKLVCIIPTLVLFKDGKEIARQAGAMMSGQIEQRFESQLSQIA
jgi:thioredoxin-like negative regulator of GroEL